MVNQRQTIPPQVILNRLYSSTLLCALLQSLFWQHCNNVMLHLEIARENMMSCKCGIIWKALAVFMGTDIFADVLNP